jgi:hypothetical protein
VALVGVVIAQGAAAVGLAKGPVKRQRRGIALKHASCLFELTLSVAERVTAEIEAMGCGCGTVVARGRLQL